MCPVYLQVSSTLGNPVWPAVTILTAAGQCAFHEALGLEMRTIVTQPYINPLACLEEFHGVSRWEVR